MKIINLTPHPIHIMDDFKTRLKTYSSKGLVRLETNTVDAGIIIDNIPITTTKFNDLKYFTKSNNVKSFPKYNTGIFYIVSQLVKSALPERSDLLVPSNIMRDSNGNILGCKSLGI
ncbi:MAG: hypothetical protein PF569_01905 [Candidatus Woesearchaeota archaeon]|jgi:hypothetical protein|nr:hypothetical protein [Candidatus Woesearchaeota archaeon]